MTTDTKSRPFAFDDCPQWQRFSERLRARGGSMRRVISARIPHLVAETRGNNFGAFQVFDRRGIYLRTIAAIGSGPEGFSLYLSSARATIEESVSETLAPPDLPDNGSDFDELPVAGSILPNGATVLDWARLPNFGRVFVLCLTTTGRACPFVVWELDPTTRATHGGDYHASLPAAVESFNIRTGQANG